MTLWYLILLAPAALVTLRGGRSAWLWLSTGAALACLSGAVRYVTWRWAEGHEGGPLASLLIRTEADRTYHDSYIVIANIAGLTSALGICVLVGLLLRWPGHPARDARDTQLFWAAALLFAGQALVIPALIGAFGMPRRYIDYTDTMMGWWLNVSGTMGLAAGAVALWAGLRPIWMTLRRRRVN